MTGTRLVAFMCLVQVLSMSAFASFAALLPDLQRAWALSGTEAGWVSGVFYVGYVAGVPVLVGLTDHWDARRLYLVACAVAAAGAFGFALLAQGFWSAMLFRALSGMGLAGTYMPGLRILTDRLNDAAQVRAVPYYTASFSLGTSFSFLLAGLAGEHLGWPWAFALAGATSALAFALVLVAVHPVARTTPGRGFALSLDLRPALRHRALMTYVLAYGGHCWELFALRAWIVAFLAYALEANGLDAWHVGAGTIASVVALAGMPASIAGAEWALHRRRSRVVMAIMGASAALGCTLGFAAALPFGAVVALLLAYNMLVMADSGTLTAGAVAAAPAEIRGAAMAVHSLVGFSGGVLGPLAVGITLDLAGGAHSALGWGLGFVAIGAGSALGLAALLTAGRRSAS